MRAISGPLAKPAEKRSAVSVMNAMISNDIAVSIMFHRQLPLALGFNWL